MTEVASIVRISALMLPVLAILALELSHERTPRERSAALFAGLWSFLAAMIVNALVARTGAWSFNTTEAMLYHVPVDMMLALGFFCAMISILAKTPVIAVALSALWLIPVYLPQAGIASLHHNAFPILVFLGSVAFVPAAFLAAWTNNDTNIYKRSFLQALMWCAILLWLFPSALFAKVGGSWDILLDRTLWKNILFLLPLLLPVGMIINALYVFARYGDGTGFPYDPPKRLVTQGIYGHISNPMQTSICLTMFWWGIVLKNAAVIASAPVAVFLFVVFKDVCNGSSNLCGNDPAWKSYQDSVPKWLPRLKKCFIPVIPSENVLHQPEPGIARSKGS